MPPAMPRRAEHLKTAFQFVEDTRRVTCGAVDGSTENVAPIVD